MHPRAEVGRERRRSTQIRKSFQGGLDKGPETHRKLKDFFIACGDYMVWSMERLHDQDQWICDLLKERVPKSDPIWESLRKLDDRQAKSKAATDKFEWGLKKYKSGEPVEPFVAAAREFCNMFGTLLQSRKNPFEPYTAKLFTDADWAKVAGVTEKSLAEEKDMFGMVRSLAPEGCDPEGFTVEYKPN